MPDKLHRLPTRQFRRTIRRRIRKAIRAAREVLQWGGRNYVPGDLEVEHAIELLDDALNRCSPENWGD